MRQGEAPKRLQTACQRKGWTPQSMHDMLTLIQGETNMDITIHIATDTMLYLSIAAALIAVIRGAVAITRDRHHERMARQ